MAEALANALLSKMFIAYSAGSAPSGIINPYALEVLEKNAIDTNGLYSKSIVDLQSIQFDVVITLCGNAKNESCPIWVGKCLKAHWGFDDPSQITDSEKRKKAFDDLFMKLKDILIKFAKRIELEPHELQKHITFIEKALS